MCERELETEQNSNIVTLTLLAISAFLSRCPGLLSRGPGGPLCRVLAFSTSIFSPTDLVFILTDFLSSPSYIIVPPPPSCRRHNLALIQPFHGQGYNILIIPRPDALVIYTGAFPVLTAWLGRRSIYNTVTVLKQHI